MDSSIWISKVNKGFNDILKYSSLKRLYSPSVESKSIIDNLESLYSITSLMGDKKSKELFIKVIIFRLGFGIVRESKHQKKFEFISKELREEYEKKVSAARHLGIAGAKKAEILESWGMNGFIYEKECEPLLGDVVLDAGAYTGTTPLYFYEKVGKEGKVYAFEPSFETYKVLEKNISSWGFPNILGSNYALSDFEGKANFTNDNDTRSSFTDITDSSFFAKCEEPILVQVTSIDKYFLERNERVDFIKMDIEGAEYSALLGAKEVIRKYTPKMAISIYHRPSDLFEIPKLILELNPNYQFFLKHNTNALADTLLFCKPIDHANKIMPLSAKETILFSSFRDTFESVVNSTCPGLIKFFYQKLLKILK